MQLLCQVAVGPENNDFMSVFNWSITNNKFGPFSANPPPRLRHRIIMTQLQTIILLLCPYDTYSPTFAKALQNHKFFVTIPGPLAVLPGTN